jgi:polyphosphate glucokinase
LQRLIEALKPNDVVIGGGNVKALKTLPAGARAGNNSNAFAGGFRLWEGKDPATRRHTQINASTIL